MTPIIEREYKRMRASGVGGIVGENARICLDLAKARAWYEANRERVHIEWRPEEERYENVYGMPAYQDEYYACLIWVKPENSDTFDVAASLGFVDQCSGPYARQVENELLYEAMVQS